MTREEAREMLLVASRGDAYVGERTPVFIWRLK